MYKVGPRIFVESRRERIIESTRLKEKLGIEFGRNVYTKENIKKMMGNAKKAGPPGQEKL